MFAYRANRSTEDALATVLYTALTHLKQKGSYARQLFVDFSCAFNTILPQRLVFKLSDLGLSQSIFSWIKDFLSDCTQRVRVVSYISSALSFSIGSTQHCVLSPLLYILYIQDCIPAHPSNSIIKFAEDTQWWGLSHGRISLCNRTRWSSCWWGAKKTT